MRKVIFIGEVFPNNRDLKLLFCQRLSTHYKTMFQKFYPVRQTIPHHQHLIFTGYLCGVKRVWTVVHAIYE